MLVRPGALAEPAVIGEVHQPARALAREHRFTRKYDLVADKRQERRRAGGRDRLTLRTWNISTAHLGQLHQPEALEKILKRQVLAERHEMHLVVDGNNRAIVVDDVNRIVGADHSR